MPIRLSGLASGLDTEALVKELVSAYSKKSENSEKEKTKLEWKKEAWEDLNTEVNTYFKSTLSSMRLSGNYAKQSVEVSDTTKASVSASGTAPLGVQTLQVNHVAKTGYLTGAQLKDAAADSTMAELGYAKGETTLEFTVKGETTQISITQDTKLSEVLSSLNAISGITASFDSNYQRIYITSSASGVENDFSILGSDANGVEALKSLGLYTASSANNAKYDEWLEGEYEGTKLVTLTKDADKKVTGYSMNADAILDAIAGYNATVDAANTAISSANDAKVTAEDEKSKAEAKLNYAGAYNTIKKSGLDTAEQEKLVSYLAMSEDDMTEDEKLEFSDLKSDALSNMNGSLTESDDGYITIDALASQIAVYNKYVEENDADAVAAIDAALEADADGYVDGLKAYIADREKTISDSEKTITDETANKEAAEKSLSQYKLITDFLEADGTKISAGNKSTMATKLAAKIDEIYNLRYNSDDEYCEGAKKVDAEDAVITLNGVEYTSSVNSFSINGLNITAKAESGEMSITTSTDVDGVYDSIVEMFKGYNELMTKFSKLYSAESARDYSPLTSDEKEEMSDDEIEKWETKIKDALLRSDSNLSSLISLFNTAMTKQVYIKDGESINYNSTKGGYVVGGEVVAKTEAELRSYANANGYKAYSMSDFGCGTLSYFNAADNEHYNIHIDGNKDDGDVSDKTDKLRTALSLDPETVGAFFSGLVNGLYTSLNSRMTSTDLNSKYSVYNDKKLDKDISEVQTTIDNWKEKLEDLEDYWYSKFSTMESMLSKLQSQQNSLSGLLGTS